MGQVVDYVFGTLTPASKSSTLTISGLSFIPTHIVISLFDYYTDDRTGNSSTVAVNSTLADNRLSIWYDSSDKDYILSTGGTRYPVSITFGETVKISTNNNYDTFPVKSFAYFAWREE